MSTATARKPVNNRRRKIGKKKFSQIAESIVSDNPRFDTWDDCLRSIESQAGGPIINWQKQVLCDLFHRQAGAGR